MPVDRQRKILSVWDIGNASEMEKIDYQ